ncbi:hypothetical protein TNCV_1688611 [Trichonephila clavipes]|nr:hypothetical protein TNCV_1688611 [Trichonephila clavipes]
MPGELPSPKIFDPTAKRMSSSGTPPVTQECARVIPALLPVSCVVDHSNLLTTAKDSRANRYINERLSLKSHLPGSVPL